MNKPIPKARQSYADDFVYRFKQFLTNEIPEFSPIQTCINCVKFNEQQEYCAFFRARPPARVIAFGCNTKAYEENYLDAEIPF